MKGLVKPGFFFIFYLPSCISALCYKAYLVSIWYRHPTINRRRSVSVQTCLPNIVCKLQWVCFLQSISFDCWSSKHNVIIAVRWKIQDKKIRFPKRRHFVQEYPRRLKPRPVNREGLESKLPRDLGVKTRYPPGTYRNHPVRFRMVPGSSGRFRVSSAWIPRFTYTPEI